MEFDAFVFFLLLLALFIAFPAMCSLISEELSVTQKVT